ncbi:hypothetical protein ACFFQW_35070 [Umezawaea endophytica]|uniref:Uncharacterized protein n=1 Tax=Umezawaea endophytica TaxID=1654476 RepID=A0A9X3AIY9_9PSEU|nr:hypothetical protein [Umezawaea endophytica]MCS7483737.1 hypothetical protein [Umezawaea endophytica]
MNRVAAAFAYDGHPRRTARGAALRPGVEDRTPLLAELLKQKIGGFQAPK